LVNQFNEAPQFVLREYHGDGNLIQKPGHGTGK